MNGIVNDKWTDIAASMIQIRLVCVATWCWREPLMHVNGHSFVTIDLTIAIVLKWRMSKDQRYSTIVDRDRRQRLIISLADIWHLRCGRDQKQVQTTLLCSVFHGDWPNRVFACADILVIESETSIALVCLATDDGHQNEKILMVGSTKSASQDHGPSRPKVLTKVHKKY